MAIALASVTRIHDRVKPSRSFPPSRIARPGVATRRRRCARLLSSKPLLERIVIVLVASRVAGAVAAVAARALTTNDTRRSRPHRATATAAARDDGSDGANARVID